MMILDEVEDDKFIEFSSLIIDRIIKQVHKKVCVWMLAFLGFGKAERGVAVAKSGKAGKSVGKTDVKEKQDED